LLGLQTFLIIAGIVRLFPITGITLPFMSYGGSSLLASALIAALLGRISHEERT
jgi:cell division protein FtsW